MKIRYFLFIILLGTLSVLAFSQNQKLGAIPQHEQLKCSKENVLDFELENGVVLYECKVSLVQERETKTLIQFAKTENTKRINAEITKTSASSTSLSGKRKTDYVSSLNVNLQKIENMTQAIENLSRRNDFGRVFETDGGITIGELSVGLPSYYKDSENNWWYVSYATTTEESFNEQIAYNFLGIKTALATVGHFTTTSTAKDTIMVYNSGAGSTWAATIGATDATGITNVHGGANTGLNSQEKTTEVDGFSLHRTGFSVSLLTIDTFDTITATTFEVNIDAKVNEITTNDDNNIFGFTPADATNVTTADYDQCGSTGLATAINHSAISGGATTTFTYDADGITNIEADKGGYHSVCWRHQLDYDAVTPTNDSRNNLDMYFYDTAAKAPRFIVTWTEGAAPAASSSNPPSGQVIER